MVQASDFVSDGRIQFGALGSLIVGTTIFAYVEASLNTFLSLVDIPLSLLQTGITIASGLIGGVVGVFPTALRGAFAGAAAFVVDAGPGGFIVSVGIVLASVWILAEVIARVR